MSYQSKHTGKQIDDGIDAVGSKLGRTDDLTNNVVTFVEAEERTDIASGDTAGTLFGKILKWLKSLGKTAFSDDYNDLTNKPTKVSEFANDAGYLKTYTETDPTVPSHVKEITQANITSWNNKAEKSQIPTDVSQLNNDSKYVSETELANKGYITDYTETDPTIPTHVKNIKASDITTWNNKAEKTAIPTKTSELQNDSGYISSVPDEYVTEAELNAKGYLTEHQDISNLALKTEIPTKTSQLANDSDYASQSFVRNEIANAQLGGDDTEIDLSGYATKDDLATKVDKVTGKSLISDSEITRLASVTNYDDSAVQESITNLQNNKADVSEIPTKTSQLTNDSNFLTSVPSEYVTETELTAKGYITGYTETDPTVPDWAKQPAKPTYTKSEVGLGNVDNVKQYSSSNPPPYPVLSVNGQTGNVTVGGEISNDANTSVPIYKVWVGTQAQYEAITTLDANTEYNIIEE